MIPTVLHLLQGPLQILGAVHCPQRFSQGPLSLVILAVAGLRKGLSSTSHQDKAERALFWQKQDLRDRDDHRNIGESSGFLQVIKVSNLIQVQEPGRFPQTFLQYVVGLAALLCLPRTLLSPLS